MLHALPCSLQVIPVFAGGLDFSLPVKKFFYDPLGSGKSFINCAVSLTGPLLIWSCLNLGFYYWLGYPVIKPTTSAMMLALTSHTGWAVPLDAESATWMSALL